MGDVHTGVSVTFLRAQLIIAHARWGSATPSSRRVIDPAGARDHDAIRPKYSLQSIAFRRGACYNVWRKPAHQMIVGNGFLPP